MAPLEKPISEKPIGGWGVSAKVDSLGAALTGQRPSDAGQPLEILRTIHSFDPCMAFAVHIIRPGSTDIARFRVA